MQASVIPHLAMVRYSENTSVISLHKGAMDVHGARDHVQMGVFRYYEFTKK